MAWTLPGVAAAPQTDPATASTQTSGEKNKAKQVWTEDDLRRIRRGTVSVVGEAPPTAAESQAKPEPDEDDAEEATPSSEPGPQPARPPCKSKSWGAAVDRLLAAQGVYLGTDYWVMKGFGGDVCTTELGSVPALVRSVKGD